MFGRWSGGRCLAEGFAFPDRQSGYRGGERRGRSSAHLPPTRFIGFLQHPDQIGNRAFGERLTELAEPQALRAAVAILLLAPGPPLLFMGEEWGSRRRFPYFCDFEPELAQAVTAGRRREFARFARFRDPKARAAIPDPGDPATFASARLDWEELAQPEHADWLAYYRHLLALRRRELVPRLADIPGNSAEFGIVAERGLRVRWVLSRGERYDLMANLSDQPLQASLPSGQWIYASPGIAPGWLPPWSVVWALEE